MSPEVKGGAALGGLGGLFLLGLRGALYGTGIGALAGWAWALTKVTSTVAQSANGSSPPKESGERPVPLFSRESVDDACRSVRPRDLGGLDEPPKWPSVQPADFVADSVRAGKLGAEHGRIQGGLDGRIDRRTDAYRGKCYRPNVTAKALSSVRYRYARERYVLAHGSTYRAEYDVAYARNA